MKGQTFRHGHIVSTPGALAAFTVNHQSPQGFLHRHLSGDWGDLDQEDKQRNDQAVTNGTRLLSAYQLNDGTKIWIITEADRSATTILLPEEY